jgi:putative flippase GtrA
VAWIGNRYWTFRQHGVPPARRKFMLFNMSANVIGLALASTFRF